MKKIININLSGRVIPIEDAAYESLQRYIESLRRYFATEEGRDEIINDIESRIAELMSDKVKKGAAAVTEADMETIINTMGRVEDFEEVESETYTGSASAGTETEKETVFTRVTGAKTRGRLYRDENDKILGGVCSGIAHYFGIDPAIVRIILALLVFGAGTGILLYLILWIFVPKRPLEPVVTKRFFRNPEDRILGGVCGGLAAYFNKDAWTFRLIFLAPLLLNMVFQILSAVFSGVGHNHFEVSFISGSFAGTFILTYIVLWIILPEANSTFEKMEMRGENVDVQKIRENVKIEIESLKTQTQSFASEVKEQARQFGRAASEFTGTRGKAFASEAASGTRMVVRRTGSVIGTIVKAFVIFVLGMVAFAFFGAVIAFTFAGVGEIANNFVVENGTQKFFGWAGLLLIFGIPFLALITWLVRRIMKVRHQNSALSWTFGSLWIVGLIFGGIFLGLLSKSFRYRNETEPVVVANAALNHMDVRVSGPSVYYSGYYSFLNFDGDNEGWDVNGDSMFLSNVHLIVNKSPDAQYHVRYSRGATGADQRRAEQRAQAISYALGLKDSTLELGTGFSISKLDKFRNQAVYVEIQVPVGKTIRFDPSVEERLNPVSFNGASNRNYRNSRSDRRYRFNDFDMSWENEYALNGDLQAGIRYTMTEEGRLVDPRAPKNTPSVDSDNDGDYEYEPSSTSEPKAAGEDTSVEAIDRKMQELQRQKEERLRQKESRDQRRSNGTTVPTPSAAPASPATPTSGTSFAPMPNATESMIMGS